MSFGREKSFDFVKSVFTSVSSKYDLMNDLMSFGLHRRWKDSFVQLLPNLDGKKVLDLSCGSGDISSLILKNSSFCDLHLADPNVSMIDLAKKRFKSFNLDYHVACAEELPFLDGTFDFVVCSFGVRNFSNLSCGIGEISRVLKKGGGFFCLEFFYDSCGVVFSTFYQMYLKHVIPLEGSIVTGDRRSYEYFAESIRSFLTKDDFVKLLSDNLLCCEHRLDFCNGTVAGLCCFKR